MQLPQVLQTRWDMRLPGTRRFASLFLEYLLRHGDGGYGVRPASIKCQVSDGLDYLFLLHAILARLDEMRPKLVWSIHGNERSNRHQASVTLREFGTFPD